jgi:hypothetical protein
MANTTADRTVEDAGEKIGGARKDIRGRTLTADALASMTAAERAELVTKDRAWPKPVWPDRVRGGMSPEAAALLKIIRDRIAAKPRIVRGSNLDEACLGYVNLLGVAAEAAEGCRSEDDVRSLDRTLMAAAGWRDGRADRNGQVTYFSTFKGRSSPFRVSREDVVKARAMVAAGFPSELPGWRRGAALRHGDQGIEIVRDGRVVRGGFADDEAAWEWLKARSASEARPARAARDPAGGPRQPERPHLDVLVREGPDTGREGSVTPEEFIAAFGFRAVEFGTWLPNGERQQVLDLGYDALMDLADALGVPPEAVSLDGTLAVAFGARGGGSAAAHYEPGRKVLNMTRIRGAGTVAHEWAHALDHFLGLRGHASPIEGREPRFASGFRSHSQQRAAALPLLPDRAASLVDDLVRTFRLTPLDREEAVARYRERLATLEARLAKAAADVAAHRAASTAPDKTWLRKMAAWAAECRQGAAEAAGRLAALGGGAEVTERRVSDFLENAKSLGGEYWTRPTELWARAFESAVADRLSAAGRRSDYLVHGVEDGRFSGPDFKGDPYPAGAERKRMADLFVELVAVTVPLMAPDPINFEQPRPR